MLPDNSEDGKKLLIPNVLFSQVSVPEVVTLDGIVEAADPGKAKPDGASASEAVSVEQPEGVPGARSDAGESFAELLVEPVPVLHSYFGFWRLLAA